MSHNCLINSKVTNTRKEIHPDLGWIVIRYRVCQVCLRKSKTIEVKEKILTSKNEKNIRV